MKTFVFGYGSLILRQSIARTIVRLPAQEELVAARLTGYDRVWDYTARIHAEALDKEVDAVYLNLRARTTAQVNGVVFGVSEEELAKLAARERYYTMVEVTASIEPRFEGRVVTFVCTDPRHLAAVGEEAWVMQGYLDTVQEGCAAMGSLFAAEFARTTQPFAFPVLEGAYRFVR